jgi:hypothetical protein
VPMVVVIRKRFLLSTWGIDTGCATPNHGRYKPRDPSKEIEHGIIDLIQRGVR